MLKSLASTLLIVLYFMVVALLPLHDIHIEDQESRPGYSATIPNPMQDNFLLFLHELLNFFLCCKAEDTLNPSYGTVTAKIHPKKIKADTLSKLLSVIHRDTVETSLSFSDQFYKRTTFPSNRLKIVSGFHNFYSGLSPPYA